MKESDPPALDKLSGLRHNGYMADTTNTQQDQQFTFTTAMRRTAAGAALKIAATGHGMKATKATTRTAKFVVVRAIALSQRWDKASREYVAEPFLDLRVLSTPGSVGRRDCSTRPCGRCVAALPRCC